MKQQTNLAAYFPSSKYSGLNPPNTVDTSNSLPCPIRVPSKTDPMNTKDGIRELKELSSLRNLPKQTTIAMMSSMIWQDMLLT